MKLPQHSLLLFDKLSSAFSPNSINSVWRAHARRHPDRARRHQVAGGREPAAERAGLRQAHVDHGPEEGAVPQQAVLRGAQHRGHAVHGGRVRRGRQRVHFRAEQWREPRPSGQEGAGPGLARPSRGRRLRR